MAGLQITIKADGTQGRLYLIGSISEWNDNNAKEMRQRCQELKDSGATSCFLYIIFYS